MTVGEWVQLAQASLAEAGVSEARLEAYLLASQVMGIDRASILAKPDRSFSTEEGDALLRRRLQREPLAYILGSREFYGRMFKVTPDVLIPRQETEILVEAALEVDAKTVLDLGTGSGCLAITLKLERPDWEVVGSDLSFNALRVAEGNRRALGAEVSLLNADGVDAFRDSAFELLVTNPPYVGPDEPLMPEVRDWEPANALYASDGGLAFYRRLSEQAGRILGENGVLLTELGHKQFEAVRLLFESAGWKFLQSWEDLSGVRRVLGVRRG